MTDRRPARGDGLAFRVGAEDNRNDTTGRYAERSALWGR
jgi:hypothetical protein